MNVGNRHRYRQQLAKVKETRDNATFQPLRAGLETQVAPKY
jgi:hypothetical protein